MNEQKACFIVRDRPDLGKRARFRSGGGVLQRDAWHETSFHSARPDGVFRL